MFFYNDGLHSSDTSILMVALPVLMSPYASLLVYFVCCGGCCSWRVGKDEENLAAMVFYSLFSGNFYSLNLVP